MTHRKIKGLVLHEDTDRRLYHPLVSWIGEDGGLYQVQFDSSCEGIFHVWVPANLKALMVSNRYYETASLPLHKDINEYIIRLRRHRHNEGVWDKA